MGREAKRQKNQNRTVVVQFSGFSRISFNSAKISFWFLLRAGKGGWRAVHEMDIQLLNCKLKGITATLTVLHPLKPSFQFLLSSFIISHKSFVISHKIYNTQQFLSCFKIKSETVKSYKYFWIVHSKRQLSKSLWAWKLPLFYILDHKSVYAATQTTQWLHGEWERKVFQDPICVYCQDKFWSKTW